MEDVSVKVPSERLADFYAMYAKWLEAEPTPAVADGETKPWDLDDLDKARYVWSKMSTKAKELYQLLFEAPEVTSDELAKALGPNAGADTVAGTFAWPARYAIEVGRTPPTRGGKTSAGTVYWLESTVKTLFEKVSAE